MTENELRYIYYGITAFISVLFALAVVLALLCIPTDSRKVLLPALSMLIGGWLMLMGLCWFMHEGQQNNRRINETLSRIKS